MSTTDDVITPNLIVERPADMDLLGIRNQIMDTLKKHGGFHAIGAGMTMCGKQQADISGTMRGRKISIIICRI